ncbi:MAG TPA: tetratricopeptide repeat protein [Acidimicrobiales bacterium]|nr:tetratricopeptide repeat protein [Acidimicrobiales bacterium]
MPTRFGSVLEQAVTRLRAGDALPALAQATAVLAAFGPGAGGDGQVVVEDAVVAGDAVAIVAALVVVARSHQALADHAAARAALDRARQAVAALDEPLVRVEVLAALASQARVEGRYSDAHDRLATAIAEATAVAGDGSVMVACLRNELAVCCRHLARLDEAEALHRRSLAALESHLGPDHADVAGVWRNLAATAYARGDHRAAAVLGRRGLAIRLAALGDGHPAVAADRAALAPIVHALRRPAEAELLLRQALAVFEQVLGPDHHEVAVTLHNLAAVHHEGGRLGEAAAGYARSLEIRGRALGDDHPDLGTTLVNLAVLERARGRHEAAGAALHRAIGLLEPAVPGDHPTLLAAREELAVLTT